MLCAFVYKLRNWIFILIPIFHQFFPTRQSRHIFCMRERQKLLAGCVSREPVSRPASQPEIASSQLQYKNFFLNCGEALSVGLSGCLLSSGESNRIVRVLLPYWACHTFISRGRDTFAKVCVCAALGSNCFPQLNCLGVIQTHSEFASVRRA